MRKIKNLIVEDEVIIAQDIAFYLKELGCEVIGILVEGEAVLYVRGAGHTNLKI